MPHQQLSFGAIAAPAASPELIRGEVLGLVGRVEAARLDANLSHRRLAALSGLPVSTVRGALAGDANPQLDTLMALSHALGLRLALEASGLRG